MITDTPKYRFGFFVKYFSEKEHADAFQDGLLYARRLKHFRQVEDPLRGDVDEGGILMDAKTIEISATGKDGDWLSLTPSAPVRFNYPILDNLNIFCMTLFLSSHDHGPTQQLLEEVLAQISDSLPVCTAMGAHAVAVARPEEFIDRVEKAANEHGCQIEKGRVEYYDTYPRDAAFLVAGSNIKWRHAFLKSRTYEKQREYRFVFNTGTVGDDPLRLQIGNLRDITQYWQPRDLADASKWRLGTPESNLPRNQRHVDSRRGCSRRSRSSTGTMLSATPPSGTPSSTGSSTPLTESPSRAAR